MDEVVGTHKVTDRMLIFSVGQPAHRDGLLCPALQRARPHRPLQLQPPRPDHLVADLSQERIKRRPVLGGLINEYERVA
jgi:hypothetical protein